MKIKIFALLVLAVSACLFCHLSKATAQEQKPIRLFLFHSESCPHCKDEKVFLETLEKKYPTLELYEYEVGSDFKNINLFKKIVSHYSLEGAIPVTIIKDQPIVGFDKPTGTIAEQIESEIGYCQENTCHPYPMELLGMEEPPKTESPNNKNSLFEKKVSVFGKDLTINQQSSLVFLGFILGLADGVNPCMFSVLLFMLTYLMAIGSTKKAFKAGVSFAIATFAVYFLFMFGIIQIIDILQVATSIRMVIIIFALFAGILMVKDFFFYGKWFSLEIPLRFKPQLERLTKKGTIPSVILLAILASLVELPCTSGLPLAYITVLANQNVAVIPYLLLYNFFFILPLMLIVLGVTLTWSKVENVEAWRENTKRYMRLIAGILLIFLAIAMRLNWL